ncbi:MAG TPA: hypothetical protein VK168_14780 [Saprospiraceae bacterium]|nr:hypothetical protein [Saprospiraceae bacterium]
MEKTLLGEAFASLSAAELREFGKFVRSPFFNTRASLIAWYDYLSEPESFDPPEKDGVKSRLAHSALLALLEKYFIYKDKSGAEARNKIKLAGVYRKRNLPRHFQITLREARKERTQHNWRHAGYYQDLLDIEWEQYQFDTAQKRTDSLNLQATSDYMDLAFLTQKLRLACLAVSHQAVYKTQYDIGLLEAALVRAESMTFEPAIGLYYHCYRFLTLPSEPAEQHFLQFREKMAQHASSFPKEELRTLFLLAINFGIKKLNESSPGWLRATLDLYRSAIQLDLLLENGQISRFAFTNIVAIAVRAGEADWAESFIHEYRSFLERTWRDATASLNLARVAYARKDYATALAQLQRSDYKDSINNMVARIYQLKIYYETDEFDLLSSHLANLKNYIRRNTGIGYHRTNYTHIVQYTEQLMALRFNDAKAVEALKEKIRAEKILTEKEWFLDMLG